VRESFCEDHPITAELSTRALGWGTAGLEGIADSALQLSSLLDIARSILAVKSTRPTRFPSAPLRDAVFYPAAPIYFVPGMRSRYDDYLHSWYRDPNEGDPKQAGCDLEECTIGLSTGKKNMRVFVIR
jgi:hypothetical protein